MLLRYYPPSGLGSFSFLIGHGGRKHEDWIGLMAEVDLDGPAMSRAGFRFVRHNDRHETVVSLFADEADALEKIFALSAAPGVGLSVGGNDLSIAQA